VFKIDKHILNILMMSTDLFESFQTSNVDHLMTISLMATFVERMHYVNGLLNEGYLFDFEEQPEAWVQRLVVAPGVNPLQITTFVQDAFGSNIICSEMSELYGYPITLIDALKTFLFVGTSHSIKNAYETRAALIMVIAHLSTWG
jgi:hypothetical protein